MHLCPEMSGSQEEQTPENIPAGTAVRCGRIRRLKAGATARSSTAARTAGLREVTGEKFKVTGSARPKPVIPHQVNTIRLTWTCQPLSGAEIL